MKTLKCLLVAFALVLIGCAQDECGNRELPIIGKIDNHKCEDEESEENEENVDEVCRQGLNNSVCEPALVEDAIWKAGPFIVEVKLLFGISEEIDISQFYKFYADDNRYEHYLYFKIPATDRYLLEKRSGIFKFSGESRKNIELTLLESSCRNEESIFAAFDQSDKNLKIVRVDDTLTLMLPNPDYLNEFLNEFKPRFENISDVFESLFKLPVYFVFSLMLPMLTLEFWESFVISSFDYTDDIIVLFDERFDKKIEGCFSSEGIERIAIELLL